LIPLSIPVSYEDALELYWEMRTGEILTFSEIKAFSELMEEPISPSTVIKLKAIDSIVYSFTKKLQKNLKKE